MTRQTWRFNQVVPGILLGGFLLGVIALLFRAAYYHFQGESWWTMTWVSAVYLMVTYGTIKAILALYRRPRAPDCRPIYIGAAVVVGLYSIVSTLGYFFPRELTQVSEKATSAALWMCSPLGRDYDRMVKLSHEVDKIAVECSADNTLATEKGIFQSTAVDSCAR